MVAGMEDSELEEICHNPKVIRNRLKIFSVRNNAKIFLKIQEEFGSFRSYIWSYVDHTPILNQWKTFKEIPCVSPISDAISKDLKRRGMKFVGSKIIYSFMQAIGMVNDHLLDCPNRIK